MKANIISLEDIKIRTLDEILELYRKGYRLEESYSLQICPEGCSPSSGIRASYIGGLSMGGLLGMIIGGFLFSH